MTYLNFNYNKNFVLNDFFFHLIIFVFYLQMWINLKITKNFLTLFNVVNIL